MSGKRTTRFSQIFIVSLSILRMNKILSGKLFFDFKAVNIYIKNVINCFLLTITIPGEDQKFW